MSWDYFIQSNLPQTLATILTALVAFGVYFKQKSDTKKDVARLILQEIRFAEQQLRVAKENNYNYYLANRLLPTNNWNSNIHLFVKNLESTEIDLLSKFYANVSYIDYVVGIISEYKNKQLIEIKGEDELATVISENQQKIIKRFELSASNILKEVSDKLEFIYNTPAADKLRKIYEKKWCLFC